MSYEKYLISYDITGHGQILIIAMDNPQQDPKNTVNPTVGSKIQRFLII